MPPKPPHAAAAGAARWARKAARVTLGMLVGAWSLLLVAWLTLHWGILPQAENWRPQIERQASRALGVPVEIGRIAARSHGWVPTFELADVVLRDRQGREALRLPRAVAALSARSLLAMEPRFAQLLIDDPVLDVRRDAEGRIHIAGLEIGDGAGGGTAFADWFFEQEEVAIRGGALRWTDETRAAAPLELGAVDVLVRNGLRRHELRFDATPPAEWGERFSLRGRFRQALFARAGDWRRWSGTLHAQLPGADIAELRHHVKLPFELGSGRGALRACVEVVHGSARSATVDVALREVALRLGADIEPLAFDEVAGRVTAARDDGGMVLSLQRFGFVTADGLAWPSGDVRVALRQARDGAPAQGGEFHADRLDLGLMAQIAARLPLGHALRELLGELAPQGLVHGLAARWDGPLDALRRYEARARFSALAVAAKRDPDGGVGRPGLRNAHIELNASERGGDAKVVLDGGELEFPGVFAEPVVALDRFGAQLAWRIEPGAADADGATVELKVSQARFENADAHGELKAAWRTGAAGQRLPGTLDMEGKLDAGRAAATARYLPLGIPAAARDYVEQAVRGGRVLGATFKVKGALSEFPFAAPPRPGGEGVFQIAGRVDDVELHYVPDASGPGAPWPAFARVGGDLLFDRTSMRIRNARGRLWGVELAKVSAGIDNLADDPTLVVDGLARGPLADLLRFVNTTPVGEWTDDALRDASASGHGELDLALSLPLDDLQRSSVRGSLAIAGGDVRIRPDTPLLGNTKARVQFTRDSFSVGGQARVLGGDASIEGGAAADGTLRFSAQGTLSADGLKRAPELGELSALAEAMSGQAPYRADLRVRDGHPELTFASSLAGLAIDLPAPLRKGAESSLPLRVQSRLGADAARDELRVELGEWLQAHFVRDLAGAAPRVLRGGIGVGDTMPTPQAGVHANVRLETVDVDAWARVAERIGGAPLDDAGYLPHTVALRADSLHAGARRVTGVVAGLTRLSDDTTWRASVEADQLSGYLELHPGVDAQPGRVFARFARLSLPQAQAESVESLLEQAPTTAPALDIVVDDFELRGRKLGRVEIQAANRGGEWRLDTFNLVTPEARLAGSGHWGGSAPRRTVIDFQLELADGGAFLERFGAGGALRGGKGRLYGQVSWAGSPLALHVPSLDGRFNLALDAGQFLKGDPGAARLLSVLSLQALPRRLVLDFRDVFQEGFAFDNVSGDVTVHDGVASTNNLRLRGVQAAVLMEGQADLGRETQDLRVIVVPEINVGTASLAYAAINPAVGLGTFVAQLFLRKPLMAAGTREFHVSGTWADPRIERVERPPGAPIPQVDPPRAAAGASAPSPTP